MHYDRNIMLMTFRCLHPKVLEPEPQQIAAMDQGLFELFDATLRRKAEEAMIPRNVRNLSLLVFFAMQTTGDDVERETDDAVQYFRAVNPSSS